MKEADLNRYIVANYNKNYWGYKIPDPPKIIATTSNPRPFDEICLCDKYIMFGEAKLTKNGYSAFSLARVAEHQKTNLLKIKDSLRELGCYFYTPVILGIWEPRKYIHLFFFDIELILKLIEVGKKSILKKELEKLQYENLYVDMKLKDKSFNLEEVMIKYIDKGIFYGKIGY